MDCMVQETKDRKSHVPLRTLHHTHPNSFSWNMNSVNTRNIPNRRVWYPLVAYSMGSETLWNLILRGIRPRGRTYEFVYLCKGWKTIQQEFKGYFRAHWGWLVKTLGRKLCVTVHSDPAEVFLTFCCNSLLLEQRASLIFRLMSIFQVPN